MSLGAKDLADFLGMDSVVDLGHVLTEAIASAEKADHVNVSFTETHVVLLSDTDLGVELGGDVRDRSVSLKAGKESRFTLTSEGFGFVSVDEVEHEVPQ